MKILYLDCGMGIAGDMLMGALVQLCPSKEEFINKINAAGIPGVKVEYEQSVKCGILGAHIKVTVNGKEEESIDIDEHRCSHEHETGHEYETDHKHETEHETGHKHVNSHEHHHTSMEEIEKIIDGLKVPQKVKEDTKGVYKLIAEAEAAVHGRSVADIHFHEVGRLDAIADIAGCAIAIHELGADKIVVSPINTGFGKVRCEHGILPVPAPATAHLLKGMLCYAGRFEGELCTPTGAALLKYFAAECSNMPLMKIENIGYGMGKKDFEAVNCVRAVIGEISPEKAIKTLSD